MDLFEPSFTSIISRLSSKYRTVLNQNFTKNRFPDVSPDFWIVLEALYKEDNLTIGQLAKLTHKDNAGLSRIIDGMERNDLVNRIPNSTDKRSFLVVLTNYAKSLKEKLTKIEEETLTKSTKGLNPIEVKELVRMMNHLFDNLDRS